MAPIGTPAVVYEDPDEQGTWAPHGTDAYYVRPAMEHYRNQKFWIPSTRRFRITGSRAIYPAHCTVPTISEADSTIIAAGHLLKALQKTTPFTVNKKIRLAEAITTLTSILNNEPPQRVGNAPPPRVTSMNTNNLLPASTSSNTTTREAVRKSPHIHQRHTRSNTPLSTILEVDKPTNTSATSPPVTQPTQIQPTRHGKLRQSHGEILGYNKNSAKRATRKRGTI